MSLKLTRYQSALELTENKKDAKEILKIADELDLSDNIFTEPRNIRNFAVMHGYGTSADNGGNRRHSDST
jgi:hypothetical protein